ncbi:MAG: hypothetical protein ACTJE5_25270, partial [Pseudomonas helleri]|uniref:hypothetical protein n=1 Tax=Pseudomonas helleri TaxID=1608996 RepID=UPI003F99B617
TMGYFMFDKSELARDLLICKWFYGCCAAGRSLARLVNCYGRSTPVDTSVGASLSRDLLIWL